MLKRELSLTQATAINMIDMVGIGPFITLSIVASLMQGPYCILAWLVGALLSFMDGFVWAEMGAKWPQAGGSYIFLQKLFGEKTWGKLMGFLFIWQTSIQAPLVVASGAIGFAQYLTFLIPLGVYEKKMVSGAIVLLIISLLYRNIKSIGQISVFFWVITVGTILWLIISGIGQVNLSQVFNSSWGNIDFSLAFWVALGQASQKSIYSFLGYYNVCHLGAEIKNPEANIPKSIFISIAGITLLYLAMQIVVLGVLPWQTVAASEFVVSEYFELLYNKQIAIVATGCILVIAFSSLFSVLLGYSRVPYAAAVQGNFFSVFAKTHPKHHFPYVSLLVMGGLAFVFSLLFKLKDVITAIITMRILVQFVSQAVGVIRWHYVKPKDDRPYKMWLFPIPAVLSIMVWLMVLISSPLYYILGSLLIITIGVILFLVRSKYLKEWPFQ